MRMWHYTMIRVLPDEWLCAQFHDCIAISELIGQDTPPKMDTFAIDRVNGYPLSHFVTYANLVINEMERRGFQTDDQTAMWKNLNVKPAKYTIPKDGAEDAEAAPKDEARSERQFAKLKNAYSLISRGDTGCSIELMESSAGDSHIYTDFGNYARFGCKNEGSRTSKFTAYVDNKLLYNGWHNERYLYQNLAMFQECYDCDALSKEEWELIEEAYVNQSERAFKNINDPIITEYISYKKS